MITTVLAVALTTVLGWNGIKWITKKDTKVEDRRRGAARLAGILSSYGLKKVPEFLIDYSVGDYSGMGNKVKQLAELFTSGDTAVVAEFDAIFDNVLSAKLKDEAGRALVAARLADAVQTDDPTVVREAPVPIVVP